MGIFCGSTSHVLNLYDKPEYMVDLANFCAEAFVWFVDKIIDYTPTLKGGYSLGNYSLWAPGRCVRFQEDFTALYSPQLYSRFILAADRKIARSFEYNVFHLHTSQLFMLTEYLKVREIKVIQVTRDVDALDITALIEAARLVQSRKRALILRGIFSIPEIERLRGELSPAGLYLQNTLRLENLNSLAEQARRVWLNPVLQKD